MLDSFGGGGGFYATQQDINKHIQELLSCMVSVFPTIASSYWWYDLGVVACIFNIESMWNAVFILFYYRNLIGKNVKTINKMYNIN